MTSNPRRANAATNLPGINTNRWRPGEKAKVVAAVSAGMVSLDEACKRYALTAEEFARWQEIIEQDGISGLSRRRIEERRRASRREVREPAIVLLSADVGIDCVITNISPRGARLEFDNVTPLPPVFKLRCPRSGRSLRVHQVWHRERAIGVSFGTAAPSAIEAGIHTWLLGGG